MDDDYKDYKKLKPQQQLYKPGSGPLRRSRYGLDSKMESFDIENSTRGRDKSHYGSQQSVNGEDVNATCRDPTASNRYRKPEQQLYVPKSGDSYSDIDKRGKSSFKGDNSSHYGSRQKSKKQENHGSSTTGSGYNKDSSGRDLHHKDGSNDINFNRNYRQGSEARSMSPMQGVGDQKSLDRNRDSRSMETWAGRHKSSSGGKPPSGRRNSAGFCSEARPKHMINLDNLPPRFRKKYLESTGHQSFDSVDQLHKNQHGSNDMLQSQHIPNQFYSSNNSNWSQTLPSRGRGRLRDNESFDREKFINTYIKNYEVQNSRRSTPSSSFVNLYESTVNESKSLSEKLDSLNNEYESQNNTNNGATLTENDTNEVQHSDKESEDKVESSENQNDSESISHLSTNLSDMTNLDWTEEVEKNIKLDDVCNSPASFSQNENFPQKKSNKPEVKEGEPRESKRSARSRRRDRRSSSRGQKNTEKKERNRKDSVVSVPFEPERNRKDSNVSIPYDMPHGLKQRERERRDSHRSNRSSTIGNSRDDLDRWRSLRSYSREHSSERRIVSQCNSRDTSTNRAASPKDSEGFRVPTNTAKTWTTANPKKSNGPVNGRAGSSERRSPEHEGGGRRSKKRYVRRRRNAENTQPANTGATNWRDEIIEAKKHDRSEGTHHRNRLNSVLSEKSVTESGSQPGLIILPQSSMTHFQKEQNTRGPANETQKTLFDHHNPSKPIIIQTTPSKHDMRMERGVKEFPRYGCSDGERGARHTALLQTVDRADAILKTHTLQGPLALAANWPDVLETRKFLQGALQRLLMSDLKFCQADNIEQQFWKILYYHFIENLRKSIVQVTPEEKPEIVKLINTIIDEGNAFFENLVQMLEKTYKFNTEDYLNDNHVLPPKGLGYVGLALISVQKLYVFLGDLTRYKEQVNETNNYAKSKFWYTKAQQINPKNGRPYNQLAILAIYARRKLDAVYYYMRSLMSSNPFQSARESLLSLFDENRKKYEAAERKRRAALETTRAGDSGEGVSVQGGRGGLRREVWVRPSGHRTTTLRHARRDSFNSITPVELNKNFIMSYLHVHGKLITRIGMESFHTCACQMLGQFRSLLHRVPLPTPAPRLLQLTALNMFAVETTAQAKGSNGEDRSAWLECALGVSLLMFGAMLERCCALLPEPQDTQQHADALLLLPAIKVWSDWMLCHSSIWNPPPSFASFELESENDPWDWLAKLMNILEALDDKSLQFENEPKEGYIPVRLPEDASLAGFTPLMYMEPALAHVAPQAHVAPHAAEHALRMRKLLFFGTEYLVGVEPPVLKLEYPVDEQPRYVSAVQRAAANYPPLQHLSEDSEVDESVSTTSGPTSLSEAVDAPDDDTRDLLRRRDLLENRRATIERRRQRMQEMLSTGCVSVEVEVRPRWLVPDTNCFIDHLPLLQAVADAPSHPYHLAVPLVVVTELEGLKKCSRLGAKARDALAWVCGGATGATGATVRLATARGSLLTSRTFTAEQDEGRATNDDRVLATALNLQTNLTADGADVRADGGCVRVVVLVTDDRNLRVKALAAELPANDLLSFANWAGVHAHTDANEPTDIQNPV